MCYLSVKQGHICHIMSAALTLEIRLLLRQMHIIVLDLCGLNGLFIANQNPIPVALHLEMELLLHLLIVLVELRPLQRRS